MRGYFVYQTPHFFIYNALFSFVQTTEYTSILRIEVLCYLPKPKFNCFLENFNLIMEPSIHNYLESLNWRTARAEHYRFRYTLTYYTELKFQNYNTAVGC